MATDDDYAALPKSIKEKLDELNEAIKNHKEPATWSPSKYRVHPEWNE